MSENRKIAIVTGGSSGIGKATARALKNKGCIVYEFSRRASESKLVTHIQVDVTDEERVNKAVEEVVRKEGCIDILVNCAGSGISGAIEFTELEDAKMQLEVAFFGTFICSKAVLPYMRKRNFGRIVNISSVAGVIPIPFQAFYSSAKAAINSFTMTLANEVRPYGVTVTAIGPGDIASGFTSARKKSDKGNQEYGGRISRSVSRMEHDEINGMSPDIAGEYIAKIALKKKVKPFYSIGFTYKAFCVIMKLLPARLTNKMLGSIYAK